jgi:transposase
MVHRVQVRTITNDEGDKLLRIVRRSSGSVVTWRRAQMVLLSAQGMDVAGIAKVTFTSADRVRDVLHNFNADGFDSLVPKYGGGRPPKFTLPQRQQIKKTALARPTDHGLPFSTWSLPKLADFLVAEGVVDDISHEGLRLLLREDGVSFQAVKTWKTSTDPDYEAKKYRVLELYAIADGKAEPGPRRPDRCDLHGRVRTAEPAAAPRQARAPHASGKGYPKAPRRRTRRATYKRPHGVRHLLAGYDLSKDKLYGHVTVHKGRTEFLAFCRYLRSLHPAEARIAIVLDNFSPHLSTKTDRRVGDWAEANNVELAYVPFYGSWLNRIEAQFTALRYFALDGTDHNSHAEQALMIRRYIAWRNRHAQDVLLRQVVTKAGTIKRAKVA